MARVKPEPVPVESPHEIRARRLLLNEAPEVLALIRCEASEDLYVSAKRLIDAKDQAVKNAAIFAMHKAVRAYEDNVRAS